MIGYFLLESGVRWGGRTKGHRLRTEPCAPASPPPHLARNAAAKGFCRTGRLLAGRRRGPPRSALGSRGISRRPVPGPTVFAPDTSAYGGKRNFAVSASRRGPPFTSCLRPGKLALPPALCVSLCGVDPGFRWPVPSVESTPAWGSRPDLRRERRCGTRERKGPTAGERGLGHLCLLLPASEDPGNRRNLG